MIIDYSPPYETKSGIWELKIKVKGESGIYNQIVTFHNLKAAQEYIGFLELAIRQREKQR